MLRSWLVLGVVTITGACRTDAPTAPPRQGTSVPLPPPPAEATLPPAVRDHLNAVLNRMQANSIRRLEIDWTAFRASIFESARGAQTLTALFPAIRNALSGIGDGHSSYRSAGGTVIFVPTRTCTTSVSTRPSLPDDIGYVRVGSFSGTTAEANAFAAGIQSAIEAEDRPGLVGWIVDLRRNGGGNMWPMLAGLGPILGEDTVGHFIDPEGATTAWSYRDGAMRNADFPVTTVPEPYTLLEPRPKVAVLTDNGVASSGEATAIAFRERPNTRTFGFLTCGLSTANALFPLPDGAFLNLTISTMADRTKKKYGGQLVPDEIAANHADMVNRAVAWLQQPLP